MAIALDFTIPLNRSDLQNKSSENSYAVDEILPKRLLPTKLQEFSRTLRSAGAAAISSYFEVFYSILSCYHELDLVVKEESWEVLIKACRALASELEPFLDDELISDNRSRYLSVTKMLVYLLCQFMEMHEAESTQPSNIVTARGRKKKLASAQEVNWSHERDVGLKVLLQILQLHIQRLWSPPVAEEDFVNLVSNVCYKFLENPDVCKDKTAKDITFNILGTLVKRYSHGLSCCMKIVQLMQHFEHLGAAAAQGMEIFVNQYGNKAVVADIIREISAIDSKDLIRDTSGTRNYVSFLTELTDVIPNIVMPHMVLVVPLLDDEPYTMRNCVLVMMARIVLTQLSGDGLDEKQRDMRDKFLDMMEDHILDVNAFTRSKCLQLWTMIVNEKALPLNRQIVLLEQVNGRLKDKSSNVRKQAVILLVAMLKHNPFTPKLTATEMQKAYEKELEKLEEIKARLESNTDVLAGRSHERWLAMSEALTAAVDELYNSEERETEEGVEEEDGDNQKKHAEAIGDDTPLRICERIVQHLTSQQYKSAVSLLKSARVIYREDPHFVYTPPVLQYSDTENDSENEADKEQPITDKQQLLGCMKTLFFDVQQLPHLSQQKGDKPIDESGDTSEAGKGDKADASERGEGGSTGDVAALEDELCKQKILVEYLKDSSTFAALVDCAIPIVCRLLGSKNNTDVLEAINLFVTGFEFGLPSAMLGIRSMLPLIWSKETTVKDAVVHAYQRLYLDQREGQTETQHAQCVSNNLIALISTPSASLDYLTSLEELVSVCTEAGQITTAVIQMLWKRFTLKITNTTPEESHAALKLLVMAASKSPEIVQSNINVIISEGLGERAENDLRLAKDACVLLAKLQDGKKQKKGQTKAKEPFRMSMDHDAFERITYLLMTGCHKKEWIPFAEAAITVMYKLAEHPDQLCERVLQHITTHTFTEASGAEGAQGTAPDAGADEAEAADESDKEGARQEKDGSSSPASSTGTASSRVLSALSECNSVVLTNLLFFVGEVALRQLVHLDVAVCNELKRRQHQQDEEDKKTKQRRSMADSSKAKEADAEEEMLGTTTADDAEAEYIKNITEAHTVTGDNLLAVYSRLIVTVCSDKNTFNDPALQAAACSSLSKFMLVSSSFCEDNLQLLFTVLERSSHPLIRSNAIIVTGDLMFRYPNLLVPWTPHLYARLRDSSTLVRKNAIMVLTHLILNDMVKVKGQISGLAVCIVDENELISNRAKLFFNELGKKGNAVYNIMPDVISRLSDPEVGVEEKDFKVIMNHLFSFISKERQCESLVEKLCQRFRATVVERQWRDLALCLSLLSYSDRSLRKLQENFTTFSDKLYEEDVYNSFCAIMSGARKFAKPETRTLVDELEARIKTCHDKGVDDDQAVQKASKAKEAKKKRMSKASASTRKKTKGRRTRVAFDDSDEFDSDVLDSSPSSNVPTRERSKRSASKKKTLVFSDDSDFSSDVGQDSDGDIENVPPPHSTGKDSSSASGSTRKAAKTLTSSVAASKTRTSSRSLRSPRL